MSGQTGQNKKNFIAAFKKNGCNVSASCAAIGIVRQTYYDWVAADEEFAQSVSEAQDAMLDMAESALQMQIFGNDEKGIAPNVTAQIFFLKTKGKARGYVERTEVAATVEAVKSKYILGDGLELEL